MREALSFALGCLFIMVRCDELGRPFSLVPAGDPTSEHFSDIQVNTFERGDQEKIALAACNHNQFVVVWNTLEKDGDDEGSFSQFLDSEGTKLGQEFQLNTHIVAEQEDPSVAVLPNGQLVAAWESDNQDGDDDGVFGQLFDTLGTKQGLEHQVPTLTADKQGDPSIAVLGSVFVVIWRTTNQDQDGLSEAIKGQLFDFDFGKVGNEFFVNSHVAGDQQKPDVTALGADRFVVVWQSEQQDGHGLGVIAQIFDTSANRIGQEFVVNTRTAGNQQLPQIAALGSHTFFIVWEAEEERDVWGQFFDSSGTKIGGQFQISNETAAPKSEPAAAAWGSDRLVVTWTEEVMDGETKAVFVKVFNLSGAQSRAVRVNAVPAKASKSRVAALDGRLFAVVWEAEGLDADGLGVACRVFRSGLQSRAVSILESQLAGAYIGRFANSWNATEVEYSLVAGEGDADNAKFEVVRGELRSKVQVDWEKQQQVAVRVRASAGGGEHVEEQSFRIAVVDVNETPTDLSLGAQQILERQPAQRIGELTVRDPDEDDTATYTLVAGEGADHNHEFEVNGNELWSAGELRRDGGSVKVRVRASDRRGLYSEATFEIQVLPFDFEVVVSLSTTLQMKASDLDAHARSQYKAAIRSALAGITSAIDIDDESLVEHGGRRSSEDVTLLLPTTVSVGTEGAAEDLKGMLEAGVDRALENRGMVVAAPIAIHGIVHVKCCLDRHRQAYSAECPRESNSSAVPNASSARRAGVCDCDAEFYAAVGRARLECVPCPEGGRCEADGRCMLGQGPVGSGCALVGEWKADNFTGRFTLVECPPGYDRMHLSELAQGCRPTLTPPPQLTVQAGGVSRKVLLAAGLGGGLGLLLLACGVGWGVRRAWRNQRDALAALRANASASGVYRRGPGQTEDAIAKARGGDQRSQAILEEMFPRHVAAALVRGDERVKEDKSESCAVFFSDIVGFTDMSSRLDPSQVNAMLDRLFEQFDALAAQHGVYKIDTIGDCYIGVTHLVEDQADQHHDMMARMAAFALEAIVAAQSTRVDPEDEQSGFVRVRVGLDVGPVVGHVQGRRQKKYTICGNTVNTASRMESTGVAGKVQCTGRAAQVLREQDGRFVVTSRGEVEVKGRGTMETFFVEGKVDGEQATEGKPLPARHDSARSGNVNPCPAEALRLGNPSRSESDSSPVPRPLDPVSWEVAVSVLPSTDDTPTEAAPLCTDVSARPVACEPSCGNSVPMHSR